MSTKDKAASAKTASIKLAGLSTKTKNEVLSKISEVINKKADEIIAVNEKDIAWSQKNNLPEPLIKRLKFDKKKIKDVTENINSLISLPDPVGKTLSATELDKNLELYKVSCPIGLIGIIFESRPDALVQISSLCLKSGNAVILKGGSEAQNTNKILFEIFKEVSESNGLPEGWIQLIETRSDVNELLRLEKYIDLLIPRGSNEFVKYIMNNTNIPVLGHADGICHVYIDKDADKDMAINIAFDSKTQYVSVCNAAETILIHKDVAQKILPVLKSKLDEKNVEIYGCNKTCTIINANPATENSWSTEYLDYKCSIKIVESEEEAIEHINKYGSHHTDAIISNNEETAKRFMEYVDSANVFWNCSTRFSDGYRYGLGAEVGISTNKIHARGPVGLEGLVIYKWKLIGNGHIVADYVSGNKKFIHKKIY
jgi:glutamate-5-semialdehyde dehydrogenase